MRDLNFTSDEELLINEILKEAETLAYKEGQEMGRIEDWFIKGKQLEKVLRKILGLEEIKK